MGWGLYLRGIVTRTGEALPNKLLIAAILNKIPFKPDQNKYYRNYNYCIMHWMVLFPINSTIHLLNKITRSWRNFHCVLWVLLGQRKDKGNSESNSSKLYTGLTRGINLGFSETAHLLLPQANSNTYFSLRAKCWLRREVGGQFPQIQPVKRFT